MNEDRRRYQVKRYTRKKKRKRGFSLAVIGRFISDRKFLFSGIAAAVVVVVTLFATGVFTNSPTKETLAQSQENPTASASSSAFANSNPLASASSTPLASANATPSASASAAPSASTSAAPSVSASAAPPVSNRVLSLTSPYMQGDDVRVLQQKLGMTADGIFGPTTKAAVQAFQKANGLIQDGTVGTQTLSKLGL